MLRKLDYGNKTSEKYKNLIQTGKINTFWSLKGSKELKNNPKYMEPQDNY